MTRQDSTNTIRQSEDRHSVPPSAQNVESSRETGRCAAPRQRTKGRIKIASLNIRGAGGTTDRHPGEKWMRLNQLVREKRISVLAVQEAHLTQERANTINDLFRESLAVYTSPDPESPTAARGVAFIVNKRFIETNDGVVVRDLIPGRAIELSVKWGESGKLSLLNVYAPNNANENAEFWPMLDERMMSNGPRTLDVLLGDFNIVEAPEDRTPARGDPLSPRTNLSNLCTKMNLIDGWRRENSNRRAFSYVQTGTGSQSRIDRIYITPDLASRSADWKIESTGIKTDHHMVSMSLANYADPYIGHGRWSVPKQITTDKLFLDETVKDGREVMQAIADSEATHGGRNIQTIYEAFKQHIKDRARHRTKQLFAKWDKKINDLRKRI
ncbi:Endonuclease/exonuclease/phosphatase, partial [Lenzites betulinus]